MFSVILSILNNSGILNLLAYLLSPIFNVLNIDAAFCHSFVTGFIELTNGVSAISNIPCKSISTNIILCSFLLGFAGLCILLQVFSIISSSDISIKPYILGKLLHGTFAAIYTYLIIKNVSFFNLDLQPVFLNSISRKTNIVHNYFGNYNLFILFIILIFTIIAFKKYYDINPKTNN